MSDVPLLKKIRKCFKLDKAREEIKTFEIELSKLNYSSNFKEYMNLRNKISKRKNKIKKYESDVVGAIKEYKEWLESRLSMYSNDSHLDGKQYKERMREIIRMFVELFGADLSGADLNCVYYKTKVTKEQKEKIVNSDLFEVEE